MQFCDNKREQHVLLYSIAITAFDAAIGIAVGLRINSSSIIFDGVYSVIDAVMTAMALGVSVLLAKGSTRHFQFGFWHFEPMLVLLNSAILSLSCAYAFVSALNDLFSVGREVSFGPAALYAVLAGLGALLAAFFIGREARRLGSELVALDARNWLVSGLISVALGISFLLAGFLHGTGYERLVPYLDPAVLATFSLLMLPLPMMALWRSAKDIVQVAPGDLDEGVRAIAQDVKQRYGFEDFSSYVSKMGRARFVDITFLSPQGFGPHPVGFFDAIRREIAERLDAMPPSHWLTIEFTGERDWL